VLEPVETAGLTLADVPGLKARVRDMIVRSRDSLSGTTKELG
jgi:hypothetical protein